MLLSSIYDFHLEYLKNILKIIKVIPIHKKDSKLNCQIIAFPVVSLLFNIDKTLEKIMYNKLYTFLKKRTYLIFAIWFQTKAVIKNALIYLTELIRKQLDDGNYDCGIFDDFRRTFDTVDHDILPKTLKHYDIRGISNKWFTSYLSNKNQFVSLNGFNSALDNIVCGVPQGSMLGPYYCFKFI